MESITSNYFNFLFDKFYEQIISISNWTRKSGRERKQCFYKALGMDDKFIYSSVYDGSKKHVRAKIPTVGNSPNENIDFLYLISDVHSHPNGNPQPSKKDLKLPSTYRTHLRNDYDIDVKPIEIIISPLYHNGQHSLFVLQEKTKDPIDDNTINEICKEAEVFVKSNKGKTVKLDEHSYYVLTMAEFYESTGYFNASETMFDENSGFHIDVEKFAFDMDTSKIKTL